MRLTLTLSLAALSLVSFPQLKPKWTVDDIITQERVVEVRLSPDGRYAAWVRETPDMEKDKLLTHLYLTNLGTKKTVQLTRGPHTLSHIRWSPDSEHIAFLTDRTPDKDKDDDLTTQIWALDLPGGEPYALTTGGRDVDLFEWADGDTIIFAAKEEPSQFESKLKDKKDDSTVIEDAAHEPPVRLFRLEFESEKVTRLSNNVDWIRSLSVSPDGRYAVTIHDKSLSYGYDGKIKPLVYLYNLGSGQAKQILTAPGLNVRTVQWRKDSQGFYAISETTTHPTIVMASISEVYAYDVASDTLTKVDLGTERGINSTDGGEAILQVTDDGFVTLLADGIKDKPARFRISGPTFTREDIAGTSVSNLRDLQLGSDGKTVLYLYTTSANPDEWKVARLDGGVLSNGDSVIRTNPELTKKQFSRGEIFKWQGAIGEVIEGLLMFPHNYDPSKKYPLVVSIHGGPQYHDQDIWYDTWESPINLLAQRGAFILRPNYHGSTGYGLKFAESIANGKYYELPLADIEAGVDALIKRGIVDRAKVATMGWSNGAILSMALLTHSDRFVAASAGAGGIEWVSDWGTCAFGGAFDEYYFGASPIEDPQKYIKLSPLYKIENVKAPVIMFQGTEDTNVPPHHGWVQYRALQQTGKTVRFIRFPGEPHGLEKPSHQKRKVEEELAWFDQYLFGTAKPKDEFLKEDSPLRTALRRRAAKRQNGVFGEIQKSVLVPEVVAINGKDVGRFEVTRAQFAQFDPAYRTGGKPNFPASGVTFEKATAYCEWLSRLTGRKYRLPTETEGKEMYTDRDGPENTLDYWAGYTPNPEDTERLVKKASELGRDGLLMEVGSFGPDGLDADIFDLGGNVAEWVLASPSTGKLMGGSADKPLDRKSAERPALPEYVGFRVIREGGG